jgi:Zn-dependent metalloprotease
MLNKILIVTSIVAITSPVSLTSHPATHQTHQSMVSISINSTTPPANFQDAEARIEEMIRNGELRLSAARNDEQLSDRKHEAFTQYFEGIPVYGGNVSRQISQGITLSIFGIIYKGIDLDTSPTLGIGEVGLAIEKRSGAQLFQDTSELTILPTLDGGYALAYRLLLNNAITYFLDARSGTVLLKINAKQNQDVIGIGTGALGDAKKVSATQISGDGPDTDSFEARDGLRPNEIITLDARGNKDRFNEIVMARNRPSDIATDADNTWTNTGVVDAHVHLGLTYDYFYKTHDWSSFNGTGYGPIFSVVGTYNVLPNNAFFISPPFGPENKGLVAFGETYAGNPMTIADVVAHELMHGITYHSVKTRTGSGLKSNFVLESGSSTAMVNGENVACTNLRLNVSSGASFPFYCSGGKFVLVHNPGGAVNEGFADVFGTAAEFYMQDPGTGFLKADYQIGEDVPELGVSKGASGPIRSLSKPASIYVDSTKTVRYPDHFDGLLKFGIYVAGGNLYIAPAVIIDNTFFLLKGTDSAGVHWNATLFGHVFYLATEGGTNATSGFNVAGVGASNRHQIEKVFFRAMTSLMPNAVTIPLVADVIEQAAIDLFGNGSTVTQAITQALLAVGF